MRYQISGKQIDVGEALQGHVQSQVAATLEKYAGRPTDAIVVFSKSGAEHVCETTVHLSTGLTAQARDHAHDIYAAFDGCVEKMDKQLRRYKRRLKDHHKERPDPIALSGADAYILAASEESDEDAGDDLSSMIVAEMTTQIPSLSVSEAVMQMELANAPVLIFRNEGLERINVVYRRDDGNIGWVDPNDAKQ